MASGDPYGQGVTEDDLAIYQFDSLGQDSDLAHLLDDTDNDLNDETFGALTDGTGAQRDFDFAGSTSRFLGHDAMAPAPTGAGRGVDKQLVPLSSDWGADPLLSSKPVSTGHSQSPWTGLNDDPLLSRAAPPAPPAPITAVSSASPAVSGARGPLSASQGAAGRQVKTLEEVEAEMRNLSAAARQQPHSQAPLTAPDQSATRSTTMTLEEVEADMLRRRQVDHQQQQQQLHVVAQPPQGPSVQPQAAFPPSMQPPMHGPPVFLANLPPHVLQTLPSQFPALPPAIQHQIVAQRMVAFGHQLPPPVPGTPAGSPMMQPGAVAHLGAPAGPAGAPFLPGSMAGPSPSPRLVPTAAAARQDVDPALSHGVGVPLPVGAAESNLLSTLFPPLPSQTGTVASVERQLEMLSHVGHAQHPSLMGAQLQALLQHAHAAVADAGQEVARTGPDSAPSDEAESASMKRQKAEELVRAVERRILEHEESEQRRKRKAMKIASMAKHNNLMSNSDKDFITRIQVSQLLTDDPYADDFYFHIMAAIKASRQTAILAATGAPGSQMGFQAQPGIGGPGANRRPNRRDNAMNRMAQNVQRLVDIAKKRNSHESHTLSLDGALGKIATRTRSAPRPLLQVKPAAGASATKASSSEDGTAPSAEDAPERREPGRGVSTGQSLLTGAGLLSSSTRGPSTTATAKASEEPSGPLSYRQALRVIEDIYDCVLDLEQLRRIQPALLGAENAARAQFEQMTVEGEVKVQVHERWEDSKRAVAEADAKYEELVVRLWKALRVMDPLDTCTPHPFVALLAIPKGIRILPRAIRHLSAEQTLTLLTLLVATFDTLEVVREAPILDQPATAAEARQRRAAVEHKTEALLNALIAPIMSVVGHAPLRMVTGMLGLLMDRNDLLKVVRSKPGLAFLTILLSRAESLKQGSPAPESADLEQWTVTFTHLFSVVSAGNSLLSLFPSSRLAAALPFGVAQYQSLDALRPGLDSEDEPVWRFLASMAVCADAEQQQTLVTGVRDKVIENVRAARQINHVKAAQAASGAPEQAAMKIRNVNLLLNALSLDASMIETE